MAGSDAQWTIGHEQYDFDYLSLLYGHEVMEQRRAKLASNAATTHAGTGSGSDADDSSTATVIVSQETDAELLESVDSFRLDTPTADSGASVDADVIIEPPLPGEKGTCWATAAELATPADFGIGEEEPATTSEPQGNDEAGAVAPASGKTKRRKSKGKRRK